MLHEEVRRAIERLQASVQAIAHRELRALFNDAPSIHTIADSDGATRRSASPKATPLAKRTTTSRATPAKRLESTLEVSIPTSGPRAKRSKKASQPNQRELDQVGMKILTLLEDNATTKVSRSKIVAALGLDPEAVAKTLRYLVDGRKISRRGTGRGTYFQLASDATTSKLEVAAEPNAKPQQKRMKAPTRADVDALVEEGLRKRLAADAAKTDAAPV